MVSKRDFDNVTYYWSCNIYAYIVRVSLKPDLRCNYQHLSFLSCLLQSSTHVYQHFKIKIRLWEVRKVCLLFRLKYVKFKNTWKTGKLTPRSSIQSLKIRMTSHSCNKYEQITLSYLLSVNCMSSKVVLPTYLVEDFEGVGVVCSDKSAVF